MSSKQFISIIGNCGGGHEIKEFPAKDGKPASKYADVSVACNSKKQGQDLTTWYRCRCYGKDAESAVKFVKKGDPISFDGQYEFEVWTDKDGKERFTHQVHVKVMTFLSSGKKDDAADSTPKADDQIPF